MSADQIVSNLLAAALALATGAALWRHVLPREVLAAASDWWRGMGRASRVFLAALLVTGVIYGGGKMRLLLPPQPQFPLPQPAFTESERAAGFACVAGEAAPWMPTNAAVLASFASSTNAAAHWPWLATGVCDDYFTLTPPTNAPIRLGTNGVRRLVVFSQGAIRAILDDGSHALLEPCRATLAFLPESAWAAQGVTSRCWTASSPASTVVAWENALHARDPSRPLSFQVEFLPDGDGGLWTGGGTTTAVTLEEVLLPTAPGGRLAVRAGTSVAMLAACAPAGANPDTAECDWFLGRRKRDGSYDDWEKIAWEVSGSAFSCPMTNGGVYRVKVEMTLAGETQETFYKIKSRTDLDPPTPHYDVGGYDHIGVASEEWQLTLRNEALPHLGSTEYAEAAFVGVRHGFAYFSRGTDKCNIFVAHVAEDAGLNIPGIHGHNPLLPYPPLANDWATGAVPIRGWQHLSANHPEPGWIVGHFAIGNGHCGIVDYDGFAIAAGQNEVNRKDGRFMDGTCGYNKVSEGTAP